MKTLFSPASLDDLIRFMRAWRFWVLGALVGSLAGLAFYFVKPPEYRARATVVVSFNMEKAWPNKPDNELFYYLERESRKVEEVAWADATLQKVADQTGLDVSVLRSGKLELSQPQDGGWHFYASDPSAETASRLAAAWAQVFSTQVQQGIQTAVTLEAARKALENNPADLTLQANIKDLESKSLAITPELQISLAQGKNLPAVRKNSPGVYAMAGAGLLLALASLVILFKGNRERA
jgi:capsular polysaccharide biosynthesis protein